MSHRCCLLLLLSASLAVAQKLVEKRDGPELIVKVEGGPKPLTPDELKKEFEKQRPAMKPLSEWRLFRGDATRTASTEGGIPFLEPVWKFNLYSERTTRNWLDQAAKHLDSDKQPVLSSSHPLAVVFKRKDGDIPQIVYRSYWGIHARTLVEIKADDTKANDIFWEAPGSWSLERMLKEPKYVGTLNQWLQAYVKDNVRPGILLENANYGTLSTDGVHLYAVEDFQIPPYIVQADGRFPGFPGGRRWLGDALQHNRLQAYDLDSGKLEWEIGSVDGKEELTNSYFLSSPLTLDGKLFVLNEKDKHLRLLTLESKTGKVLAVHPLATFRDPINVALHRRFMASHLAHAEGVLVAPTQAGSVLGVDPKTGQLLWAYPYGEKKLPEKPPEKFGEIAVDFAKVNLWRDSVPMIAKGRVVYAPGDGNAVHCMSLREGSPIWKHPRRDGDVYVGGIVNDQVLIVGKETCRAINLSDGKLAWIIDTGMPSGLGVTVEGQYYLPLAKALHSGAPEICVLDVARGRVATHVRSRKNETVGNLLFHDGKLISQTTTTIAAYPLQKAEQKLVEDLLRKKENDAVGLAKRGDLKLDKGDLKGAVEDFIAARKNDPPKELQARLYRSLFEALIEYLHKDFDAALPHLKAAEELSKADAVGTKEERSARRRAFLIVAGRGFEKQKKPVEAARYYLDLIDLTPEGELTEVPGEPGLKVSPVVLARRQLEKILESAGDEERKKIEQEILDRLKKGSPKQDNPGALRGLASVIGTARATGREARFLLADRLAQQGAFLEAQQWLLEVRRQKHDRNDAAKAVHALARLYIREGLIADAVASYRELAREYGEVVVLDKKTGKDLLDELLTDKRLLPYLERSKIVPGKVVYKATLERGNFPFRSGPDELEREGEPLPFFDNHLLGLERDRNRLLLSDRWSKESRWSQAFPMYHYLHLLRAAALGGVEPKVRYQNLGHLVIVTLGHRVIAVDPVKRALLWEKALWGWMEERRLPTYRSHVVDPRDGSLRIHYDAWIQRIPARGLASPSAVVMQRVGDFMGVEPLTGRLLWSRTGIADAADLFHDGEHLFVVEMDEKREPTQTHILDLRSGESLKRPDFAKLYRQRLRSHGRTLLLSETDDKGALTLRQHDLIAGKDVWKKTFTPRSLVLETEDDALTGVVQPDGKVFVFDLDQGKEVMKGEMKVEHVKEVEAVHVVRDAAGYYFACREPKAKEVVSFQSNFKPDTGLRGPMVNGMLYAFDKEGELSWFSTGERRHQVLLLNRFADMPVVILSGKVKKFRGKFREELEEVETSIYDKRTGKILNFADDLTGIKSEIHTVTLNEKGIVEVLRPDARLRIEPR